MEMPCLLAVVGHVYSLVFKYVCLPEESEIRASVSN